MTLFEAVKTLPVAKDVDVVVVGGGIAGVAAALAAARGGAKTILLEKECALGGLATLGLVIIYLPLCDGYGRQVIGGIGEELLRRSLENGVLQGDKPHKQIPPCWDGPATPEERAKHRFQVHYEAAPMILTLENLLREAGVDIWYDTRLCATSGEEKRVTHVIVENKSGRMAIAARAFVDATGDADLCVLAGEATGECTTNRRSGWYFSEQDGVGATLHPLSDNLYAPAPEGSRFYRLSGKEVSAYTFAMHDMILDHAKQVEGRIPFLIPTIPLFRMTRRLEGRATLTTDDLGKWREDTVAMTGDWRRPAPVYAIGIDHLMGRADNLFAAGRCISSDGDAWDVTRVIPTCAATGQAAGAAAAMVAQTGKLDLGQLQAQLKQAGAILDPELTR